MLAAVWAWRDGTLVAKVSVYSTDMGPVGAALQWCAEGLAGDAVVLLTPVSGTGDGEDWSLVLTGADRQARVHVIESKVAHLDGESISVEEVADVDLDRSGFVPVLLKTMRRPAVMMPLDLQVIDDLDELGVETHRAHMDVGAVHGRETFSLQPLKFRLMRSSARGLSLTVIGFFVSAPLTRFLSSNWTEPRRAAQRPGSARGWPQRVPQGVHSLSGDLVRREPALASLVVST